MFVFGLVAILVFANGDHVVARAVGACCPVLVQGSSGVPGELALMPEIESLGVVGEKIISPHESIGWSQSRPNIVGGVWSQVGAGAAQIVWSLPGAGIAQRDLSSVMLAVVIVESWRRSGSMGSMCIGVVVASGVGRGLGGDVVGCWWQ